MPADRNVPGLRERHAWVDVAKAITIVLIVTYHVAGAGSVYLFESGDRGPVTSALWGISQALTPVRIPLFFVLAGFLVAGTLDRPWRAVLQPKVTLLLWVFLVWSALFSIPYGILLSPDDPAAGIADSLLSIPLGGNAYWFLFVLPLYFVAVKALRRQPALTVVIALAAYFASPWLAESVDDPFTTLVRRTTGFFLWYALGAHLPRLWARLSSLPWFVAPLGVGLYVLVWWLRTATEVPGELLTAAATLVGITTILVLSRLLGRHASIARVALTVSGATLAIYVVHSLLLYSSYVIAARLDVRLSVNIVSDLLFVPVLVVVLSVAAILALQATQRLGLHGVFTLPRFRANGRRQTVSSQR